MFNTFAPKAVIPPSPNINAWIRRTTVNTSTAASGAKNTMATKAPPTICPLVPKGIGMFMDMIAKIPAARTAKRGIRFSSKLDLAHFTEKYNARQVYANLFLHFSKVILFSCFFINEVLLKSIIFTSFE